MGGCVDETNNSGRTQLQYQAKHIAGIVPIINIKSRRRTSEILG